MVSTDIGSTDISNMTDNVPDFSVDTQSIEGAQDQPETFYDNVKWTQYLGYYKTIPELKSSIDAIARWTMGKGFQADGATTILLENITGYGEDTFDTILKNMIVVSQIGGDAFAEIIRNKKTKQIINLKPLDPEVIRIVVDRQGLILRYEQRNKIKKSIKKFQPIDMLHLVKGRVADEIHGISIIESVEKVILMKNEALEDFKTVLHRNVDPVIIWHLDTDDPAEINKFIKLVENRNKKKENIFIPKGAVVPEVLAVSANATMNPLPWIQNLSSFFYQAVGIPQIILGGSQEFNEATAKIAYLAFQQTVEEHQRDIEDQLWSQLAIKIKLEFPASLENELLSDEKKDAGQGQTAVQPSDVTAGRGE